MSLGFRVAFWGLFEDCLGVSVFQHGPSVDCSAGLPKIWDLHGLEERGGKKALELLWTIQKLRTSGESVGIFKNLDGKDDCKVPKHQELQLRPSQPSATRPGSERWVTVDPLC